MRPKLADDAHVLLFCAPVNEPQMRKIVEAEKDLDIRSYLIWVKNAPSPGDTTSGLAPTHERLIHAAKGNPPATGFLRDRRINDVLHHSRVSTDKHPTRKPAALLTELIGSLTDAGDVVADPVGGSGSTLVAALQRGRRAWGAEYAPGYHAEGADRIVGELRRPRDESSAASGVAGATPPTPIPEVRSEKPPLAARRLVEKLYGLRDPLTEARSSPPDDEAFLLPVLRAWLSSFSEKPGTLVEPFAFHHSQSGLLASLAYPVLSGEEESPEILDPPLADHILLIESEQSKEVTAAWRNLLAEPFAIRLVESVGLMHYAFGSLSTPGILEHLSHLEWHSYSGGQLTPSDNLEQVSAEGREALRSLFPYKPFWISEMAHAVEPNSPFAWSIGSTIDSEILTYEEREVFYEQESEIFELESRDHEDREMLEQEREFLKTQKSIRRLSEPLEGSIRRLAKAVDSGGVEFRKPSDATGGVPVSGLEALEDPHLVGDSHTVFFVVPPRNIGYEDSIRLLSNLAGDGIACMPESRPAIARARDRGLAVRRLGRGRIADYEPGEMLLIGKDLSWAD
jgi:hypothetical protein